MTGIIDARDIIFEYPGRRALDGISFALEAGSITALVGPNGAGKTTLMRCLCGLQRPMAGSIVVAGIDVIAEPRRSHERIGFLPDTGGLYDELTVAQCLRYAAEANGVRDEVAARVQDTAHALHLETRICERAGELSRGLRQRVAIAQAIIHRPRVLVLDEPASGLDPEARHDLSVLFRALRDTGMSLLVSSHILAELEDYATDMLVLREGRLLEQRRLAAPGSARRLLEIRVMGDPATAAACLRGQAGVSEIRVDGECLRAILDGADAAQAALLAALVAARVPVLSFAAIESDLQQSYLASVRGGAAERA